MTATLIKSTECITTKEDTIQSINIIGVEKINYSWTSPSKIGGKHITNKKIIIKYLFTEV
jgi:hypothetical protein